MARYKLMARFPEDEEDHEVLGQRKKTKAEVEAWISDNINACGLDWRAGYTLKLRDSSAVYRWHWINTGKGLVK